MKMVRLTKEQVKFYDENGFIQLSNIFSDKEVKSVSDEYDRLFFLKSHQGVEASWQGEEMKKASQNIEYSVQSIHNLQYHSSIFSQVLHKESLLEALEGIMKTPNILLHHTKAHSKPPGKGAPYLMHQDYHYFPFKNDSMVAVFMCLDDMTPENGGLCFYTGSHKLGPLEDVGTIEKGEAFHYMDPKKWPIDGATPVSAKRGDIIVFSYLLLHGSYMNLSTRPRRMFLIQVRDANDEPLVDLHKSPGYGWVLRGRNDKRTANFFESQKFNEN